MTRIQIRIPDELGESLAARATPALTRSEVVRLCVERYVELVHRETPVLAPEEWTLLAEESADSVYADEAVARADWWRLAVREAIVHRGAAARHGIADPSRLLALLDGLTYAQCVAVLDRLERHWAERARELAQGEELDP